MVVARCSRNSRLERVTNGDQPGVRLTKAAASRSVVPASVSKPASVDRVPRGKTARAAEKKR